MISSYSSGLINLYTYIYLIVIFKHSSTASHPLLFHFSKSHYTSNLILFSIIFLYLLIFFNTTMHSLFAFSYPPCMQSSTAFTVYYLIVTKFGLISSSYFLYFEFSSTFPFDNVLLLQFSYIGLTRYPQPFLLLI